MWSPRQVTHLPVGSFTSPGIDTRYKGPTAFSVSSEKTQRFTISNVESQVFTPNNSRLLARESNPGRRRDKLAS